METSMSVVSSAMGMQDHQHFLLMKNQRQVTSNALEGGRLT
jgi:hypothetical protein